MIDKLPHFCHFMGECWAILWVYFWTITGYSIRRVVRLLLPLFPQFLVHNMPAMYFKDINRPGLQQSGNNWNMLPPKQCDWNISLYISCRQCQNMFVTENGLSMWCFCSILFCHDDVIKWKHDRCYWTFVRGFHRSAMKSPHKGQWRGALKFSLICTWIDGWLNNREAGDTKRHRAHDDATVMLKL